MNKKDLYKGCYGNCINSFDENGNCTNGLFNDVIQFAYIEENSKEISYEKFKDIVNADDSELEKITNLKNALYLYNEDFKLCMIYNEDTDVHYFFKESDKPKKSIKLRF